MKSLSCLTFQQRPISGCECEAKRANLTYAVSFWSPLQCFFQDTSWGCACRARSLVFESARYPFHHWRNGCYINVFLIGDLFGSTKVPGTNHYKQAIAWVTVVALASYIPIFLEQICHCHLFACDQHFSFLLFLSMSVFSQPAIACSNPHHPPLKAVCVQQHFPVVHLISGKANSSWRTRRSYENSTQKPMRKRWRLKSLADSIRATLNG